MIDEVWAALGGDPSATEGLELPTARPFLPSPLAVGDLATATVTAALLAAAELAEARGGRRPAVSVDARHVAVAFRSERHLLVDGSAGESFAPLSAFLPTADGWVRLHANYPHHRAALLRTLGLSPDADGQVADAVRRWTGEELETAVVAAGGVAAAVRTEQAWRASPQGLGVSHLPLVDGFGANSADGVSGGGGPGRLRAVQPEELPASGVRVLDLTRVIAGPVGTRTLAALGADVLRVDSPRLAELPRQALDGGPGKRSTLLDLGDAGDRQVFERLLAEADVLVQGYRPGALAAYGLDQASLAARHPHLVTVTLSAWGHTGPWAQRRGFDSLVQAATGIAERTGDRTGDRPGAAPTEAVGTEPGGGGLPGRSPVRGTGSVADGGGRPGALPAQALDHGTGYLVAAAALRALAVRERDGVAVHARLALARTAHWLLDRPTADDVAETPVDASPYRVEFDVAAGRVSMVAPPGRLDGRPLHWSRGPSVWGADPPTWR